MGLAALSGDTRSSAVGRSKLCGLARAGRASFVIVSTVVSCLVSGLTFVLDPPHAAVRAAWLCSYSETSVN